MTDGSHHVAELSIDARVAVLEERTRPKDKTPLDRLKDWGGVASLVIAIAYSFPLGLWDRWFEAPKKLQESELVGLRQVLTESTSMMAEYGRAIAGLSDAYLAETVSRAYNTRLYLLMDKNAGAFKRRRQDFNAPELLVIGYNLLMTNQTAAAIEFFEVATEKAAKDPRTEVEARRQLAKAYFLPGQHQDITKGRQQFSDAVTKASQGRSYLEVTSYVNALAEWGLFELMYGDWKCGQSNVDRSLSLYAELAPMMNDKGSFGRMISEQVGRLKPRTGQPTNGCT